MFCLSDAEAGAQAAAEVPVSGPSLSEAIALARNNPDYLSQHSQLPSAEWNLRSAYGSLIPSVNAPSSLGYTATGERRLDSVVLGEQPSMYSSRYNLARIDDIGLVGRGVGLAAGTAEGGD